MIYADLHLHSTHSDGTDRPLNIIEKALDKKINVLALTDHDTTSGLEEFNQFGKAYEMITIPAIEISTNCCGRMIDILGYNIKYQHPFNQHILNKLSMQWYVHNSYAEKIINRYYDAGLININFKEFCNFYSKAVGPLQTKLWIRNYRMTSGNIDLESAKKEFKKGGVAYTKRKLELLMSIPEAIKFIHDLKGKAILAHPGKYFAKDNGFKIMKTVTNLAIESGIDGVEKHHASNLGFENEIEDLILKKKSDLIITGGSDYHGKFHPEIEIGSFGLSKDEFEKFYNKVKHK